MLIYYVNRAQIAEAEGINAEEMVLIHGFQTLEDDQLLSVYGIQDGKIRFVAYNGYCREHHLLDNETLGR